MKESWASQKRLAILCCRARGSGLGSEVVGEENAVDLPVQAGELEKSVSFETAAV